MKQNLLFASNIILLITCLFLYGELNQSERLLSWTKKDNDHLKERYHEKRKEARDLQYKWDCFCSSEKSKYQDNR